MNTNTTLLAKDTTLYSRTNAEKTTSKDEEKLNDLAQIDNRPLLHIVSTFPFDLFPNKVIVDRNKVTVIDNVFFYTRQIKNILIKDIQSVIVEESLLFSSLKIADRLLFPHEPLVVPHLKKSEARMAQQLIEGLLLADKENIDVTNIPTAELFTKLQQVGRTRGTF